MVHHITTPLSENAAKLLKAGDTVYITGTVYTARDAAHKRLAEIIEAGGEAPFPVCGGIIYYTGPTPAKPGQVIGSAGPTTSSRMDKYTPDLLDLGLRGMIGKGARSVETVEAMKRNSSVYFGAIGGAGALLGSAVIKAEVIAYEDLGAEAIHRLEVKDFPAVVVIDCEGDCLYETGRQRYIEVRDE
ncbi:MAG: Fe-S-containing hydro-lyase [Oscillospiraceae bacterium]|nr:Fe-S-containing hydro-lyase [Oscillospiraceae bacterium]